jgi:hypothetical protein
MRLRGRREEKRTHWLSEELEEDEERVDSWCVTRRNLRATTDCERAHAPCPPEAFCRAERL